MILAPTWEVWKYEVFRSAIKVSFRVLFSPYLSIIPKAELGAIDRSLSITIFPTIFFSILLAFFILTAEN